MNSHGPRWGWLACSSPDTSTCCLGHRRGLWFLPVLCQVQEFISFCCFLDYLCQEAVGNAFQKPPWLLVPCCFGPPPLYWGRSSLPRKQGSYKCEVSSTCLKKDAGPGSSFSRQFIAETYHKVPRFDLHTQLAGPSSNKSRAPQILLLSHMKVYSLFSTFPVCPS